MKVIKPAHYIMVLAWIFRLMLISPLAEELDEGNSVPTNQEAYPQETIVSEVNEEKVEEMQEIEETLPQIQEVPDAPEDNIPVKAVNYAHKNAGAIILYSSPTFKGTSNLLVSDNDKYAIAPCSDKKSVVISLSEDILVKVIVLSNYEKYSSSVKEFQILGSQHYDPATSKTKWEDLGTYTAKHTSAGEESFELKQPTWARYLKFKFITHYGYEHYCTITQIKVHGSTMVQGFHEQYDPWPGVDESDSIDHDSENAPSEESEPDNQEIADFDSSDTDETNFMSNTTVDPTQDNAIHASHESNETTTNDITKAGETTTDPTTSEPEPEDAHPREFIQNTSTDTTNIDQGGVRKVDNGKVASDQAAKPSPSDTIKSESTDQASNNVPPPKEGAQKVKEKSKEIQQDAEKMAESLETLSKTYSSISCLETIKFSEFKTRVSNKIKAARNADSASNSASSPKVEPIFKTLTDEIKSLQIHVSMYDQYMNDLSSCYQQVIVKIASEHYKMELQKDARFVTIEDELRNMKKHDIFVYITNVLIWLKRGTCKMNGLSQSITESLHSLLFEQFIPFIKQKLEDNVESRDFVQILLQPGNDRIIETYKKILEFRQSLSWQSIIPLIRQSVENNFRWWYFVHISFGVLFAVLLLFLLTQMIFRKLMARPRKQKKSRAIKYKGL